MTAATYVKKINQLQKNVHVWLNEVIVLSPRRWQVVLSYWWLAQDTISAGLSNVKWLLIFYQDVVEDIYLE